MADGKQTHGTVIERVLRRRHTDSNRNTEQCLAEEQLVGGETMDSPHSAEAQPGVDRRGWLVGLMGAWALMHGASPAHADPPVGPNDDAITRALVERLLNRRLFKLPGDEYALLPEDHMPLSEKLIWYHPTLESEIVKSRTEWFGKLIDNGSEAMTHAIPDVANKSYPHDAAPDDQVWPYGILSAIKEGAQEAGKRDVFIEVYTRMRELIGNIVLHEKNEAAKACIPHIQQAYQDGYAAGHAHGAASQPPNPGTYSHPNWPPAVWPNAHHTY